MKNKPSKKPSERPGPAWFSRAELAGILDVSAVQFDRRYSDLAPADGVKRDNRRVWFHARKLLDALIADELLKAKPTDPNADPLLAAGGDSPALERYRAARADLAEMEAEERRGTHVSITTLDRSIVGFAASIRSCGEVIQRRWGNDASDVLNQALDSAVAHWTRK